MDFQARRGEDNVDARFRQAFRPVNVGLFVKTRLQLHHYGDFLPLWAAWIIASMMRESLATR